MAAFRGPFRHGRAREMEPGTLEEKSWSQSLAGGAPAPSGASPPPIRCPASLKRLPALAVHSLLGRPAVICKKANVNPIPLPHDNSVKPEANFHALGQRGMT